MKKNKLFLLCLTLSLASCRPQKATTEYRESIKVDTFIREQLRIIHEAINDTLYLPTPCDSSVFLYSKSIPNGQATLSKKGNKLTFVISTNKSEEVSEIQKEKTFRGATQIKFKETIKYRIPTWAIVTILIESALISFYVYYKFKPSIT